MRSLFHRRRRQRIRSRAPCVTHPFTQQSVFFCRAAPPSRQRQPRTICARNADHAASRRLRRRAWAKFILPGRRRTPPADGSAETEIGACGETHAHTHRCAASRRALNELAHHNSRDRAAEWIPLLANTSCVKRELYS
ncbi:hypothetical protein MRX96_004993 [Rhipicephalus microplus]